MSGASLEAAYRLLIGVSIAAFAGLLVAAMWRLRRTISLAIGLPLLVLIVFSNASDLLTRAIGTPSLLQPIIAILAIAVWFARKRLQPSQPIFTLLTLLLALYCILVFASTTWAKDLALADERVSEIVKSFAIYLLVAMLAASWSSLRQGLAAAVVTASALAMLSLFQIATAQYDNDFAGFAAVESGNIYSSVSGLRIAGPLHDPNFYAQLLLAALPFAAAAAIATRDARRRTLFTIASLVIGAAVILTYSRGAMLALVVMTVLLLAALRVRVLHFATAAAIAVLLALALPSAVTARLVTVEQLLPGSATGVERDASVEKRRLVLGTAWSMFADQPFLGVGVANFSTRFNHYAAIAGSSSPQ
jgi:putative inorganic carbon (HCO3(-)) transporter